MRFVSVVTERHSGVFRVGISICAVHTRIGNLDEKKVAARRAGSEILWGVIASDCHWQMARRFIRDGASAAHSLGIGPYAIGLMKGFLRALLGEVLLMYGLRCRLGRVVSDLEMDQQFLQNYTTVHASDADGY